MAVTTGNNAATGQKWIRFQINLSDVNLNPSINRIAKNIYPGPDETYAAFTRLEKLEIINQYFIAQLKLLSRINHIEPAIKAARDAVIAEYDLMIDLAEDPV